ncbi:alpha-protein kinase vwkA-like [Haliotis asinina]|uniref:alpha-protein kinase vwkA-like n=1 Tax=Haliotis asinina TaxID=109174 RepID=UPI0035321CA3
MAAPIVTAVFDGDSNGGKYRVDIDARPFVSGARKMVFKGALTGNGPRNSEIVIVKPFREFPASREQCDTEISKNLEAHKISQTYNDTMKSSGQWLRFILPYRSSLERVAKLSTTNNMSKSRQLETGEWVLIEEYIGDNFKKFIDDRGRSAAGGTSLLHAFVHFSYQASNRSLVISCLQGVESDNGYQLATPTIHSSDYRFGESDQGEAGILQVFQNHKCNNICRDFAMPHMLKNLNPM